MVIKKAFLNSWLILILLVVLLSPQVSLAVTASCPPGTLTCKVYQYLYVCGEPGQPDCRIADLLTLAQGIIDTLLFVVVTPVAIAILFYAGFLYLTSPSKPGQRSDANKMLTTALKGYALALAGYVIVKAIVLGLIGTNDVATFIKGVFKN